jgi:2-oxoglutarate/2-oxoacid ferredoxin oxidoreductase subunit beta
MSISELPQYTKKDFTSDQEVRWCPGCGDYSILANVQSLMPDLGARREDVVFVSGIGCSSRFPYYMETYGFHSIHGRAPAIATGVAVANPDLKVFVITGDGDGLSIGGNHLIHALRRNVDMTIILFNNQIYGLTKGQYSPTSEMGKITKSTPFGSLDHPFNPVSVALGAEATFVARSIDTEREHLRDVIEAAAAHRGTSFVEVYQNCNIFNDGAFDALKDHPVDNQIRLAHGQPIRFGPDGSRGITMSPKARPRSSSTTRTGRTRPSRSCCRGSRSRRRRRRRSASSGRSTGPCTTSRCRSRSTPTSPGGGGATWRRCWPAPRRGRSSRAIRAADGMIGRP